jgi:hypothetical protein
MIHCNGFRDVTITIKTIVETIAIIEKQHHSSFPYFLNIEDLNNQGKNYIKQLFAKGNRYDQITKSIHKKHHQCS